VHTVYRFCRLQIEVQVLLFGRAHPLIHLFDTPGNGVATVTWKSHTIILPSFDSFAKNWGLHNFHKPNEEQWGIGQQGGKAI
jgi:hypothetical protein